MPSQTASEICFLSATEITANVRAKRLSASEVLEAHLAQIERVNPKVNAIVTLVADQARAAARAADQAQSRGETLGPLHGLPIAHKDLFDTAGIRTTYGSPIYRDHIPERNAVIVERARSAGAIPIGKTNTPEFGAGAQTFNEVFGATRNPYDLIKTCGGSSGGAAVALACGMIPIADGSDHASSLRNPAAFCGVFGLRPAPGRIPTVPAVNPWSTMSVDGPMARSAADVALLFAALAGPHPHCPIAIQESGATYLARLNRGELERSFKGVRVAWFKDLGGVPFDRRVLDAVSAGRKALEDLGCIVEQDEPDFTGAAESYNVLRSLGFVAAHSEHVRKNRSLIKETILQQVEKGRQLSADEVARAFILHGELWSRMHDFLERYEYFVLPTTQVPPFDISQQYVTEIEGVQMDSYIEWMKSCYYITIVETPAISVPCGFTPEGLPIGLQIVGRHRDEWSVLQLAYAFEQVTKELRRRPEIANE